MTWRPLSDAEVHGTRAYLYSYAGGPENGAQPQRSAAEIKEALREDQNALDAMAIAFYAPSPRRPIDIGLSRADLASRASRAHPEAWLSWLMVSDSRTVQDPAARAALVEALRIDPDHPEILARMATMKASGGDWNGALALASKVLRGRFVSDDLWLLYMEGLAKTGRCADAALWDAAVIAYLPDKRARRVTREWTRIRQACVAAASSATSASPVP